MREWFSWSQRINDARNGENHSREQEGREMKIFTEKFWFSTCMEIIWASSIGPFTLSSSNQSNKCICTHGNFLLGEDPLHHFIEMEI